MHNITASKFLLFFAGWSLYNFNQSLLLASGAVDQFPWRGMVWSGAYLLSFAFVKYADGSRNVGRAVSLSALASLVCQIFIKTLQPELEAPKLFIFLFFPLLIIATAMQIPLISAFTMMQFNSIKRRDLFSQNFLFLIAGRMVGAAESILLPTATAITWVWWLKTVSLTAVIVYLASGEMKRYPEALVRMLPKDQSAPIIVHTPILRLIRNHRYMVFLIFVVLSAMMFILSDQAVYALKGPSPREKDVLKLIHLVGEAIACVWTIKSAAIIAPQSMFVLGNLLLVVRCLLQASMSHSSQSPIFPLLELIRGAALNAVSIANAQIIATHAKPGLEYTTCALVDICRSGLAPALFGFLVFCFAATTTGSLAIEDFSKLSVMQANLFAFMTPKSLIWIGAPIFTGILLLKYFTTDYRKVREQLKTSTWRY